MLKNVLYAMILLFSSMLVHGQQFQKGTLAANAGVGFGTNLGGYGDVRPAISVSADYGIWEIGGPGVISLGGYIGNTGYKYDDSGYSYKWNYNVVGVRGAYHYNGLPSSSPLDLYGGVMLGYRIVSFKSDFDEDYYSNAYGSGMGLSGFIGSRYFFSENFGLFAELGYGVSYLTVGATMKL